MDGDARNSNSHILSLLYSPYSYEILGVFQKQPFDV